MGWEAVIQSDTFQFYVIYWAKKRYSIQIRHNLYCRRSQHLVTALNVLLMTRSASHFPARYTITGLLL